MLTTLADLVQRAAEALFVPWLLVLLFGTGLFLTIRYRVVQVRRFGEAFRAMLSSVESGTTGALSPFQAFMTALSGTIGTGNIAGVAGAVPPGAAGVAAAAASSAAALSNSASPPGARPLEFCPLA